LVQNLANACRDGKSNSDRVLPRIIHEAHCQ
jgi:hypothetical protein